MPLIKLREDAPFAPVAIHDLGLTFGEKGDVLDVDAHVAARGARIADPAAEVERITKALLSNRNFVDAESGKNPNFICSDCGVETFELARFSKHGQVPLVRSTQGLHPVRAVALAAEEGFDYHAERLCRDCHAKPASAAASVASPAPAPAPPTFRSPAVVETVEHDV